MNQEQLFYRDLYLYLSNSSFQSLKPWQKWEHLTSKPLNDVLVMFYAVRTNQMTKENVAQKFSLLSHGDNDGFAKALFSALFTSDYNDLINFVNDVKTIRDGFCWLFLTTLLGEEENALKNFTSVPSRRRLVTPRRAMAFTSGTKKNGNKPIKCLKALPGNTMTVLRGIDWAIVWPVAAV